ncbi:hypothetical protein TNCV_3381621 [Trichonephila clavipes]|nr:hypothetical protein TNCV_3381621 [Trichonephila clavipes]
MNFWIQNRAGLPGGRMGHALNKVPAPERGFLATDVIILNQGQVTRTTPELALPLLTTTPTGGRLSSRQIERASLPYTVGLEWYWARTRDMPVTIRYLDH